MNAAHFRAGIQVLDAKALHLRSHGGSGTAAAAGAFSGSETRKRGGASGSC